jgi:hypothetical protein
MQRRSPAQAWDEAEHFLEVGLLRVAPRSLRHACPVHPNVRPFLVHKVLPKEAHIVSFRVGMFSSMPVVANEEAVLTVDKSVVNGQEDVFLQAEWMPLHQ